MSTAHTPAPWRIVEREILEDQSIYPLHIVGGSRDLVIVYMESAEQAMRSWRDAMAESKTDVRSKFANAQLIAAAPDLLEALRQLEKAETARRIWCDAKDAGSDPNGDLHWQFVGAIRAVDLPAARAAIAKAEGSTA